MRRAAIAMSTAFIALPALFAGVAQAQDRYGPQAEASLTPVSYAADRPMLNRLRPASTPHRRRLPWFS